MNDNRIAFLLLTTLTLASFTDPAVAATRTKTCINTGWQFHLGDVPGAKKAGFDDSGWATVHVPHTFKLTSLALDGCQDDKTQPTFHREIGWYRRPLKLQSLQGRKFFIEFEGAHQVTDLWVNGKHVGQHAVGGYTPFHFDITEFVRRGDNVIALRVDNTRRDDVPPDPGPFDYVKFSGLYRDVYLVETDPVRVTFNWEALDAGVFITTPAVDPVNGNAVIDFKTVVRNETRKPKEVTVLTRVVDDRGIVVLRLLSGAKVDAGRDHVFKQIGAIEDDLRLWSIDDPYLYRVNTTILADGVPVDMVENRLGVRIFELDHERGFLLNRKPIELIGVNRHQHYGYIGDALPNSLHYKDVFQLKQLGMNVIRTAHYPQDNALIEACDELGLLVYEEAPTWISISQNPKWYDHYEAALRTMIRNHRNHPSVVIWGAGINHRGYVPRAVLAAKQEDPTRFTASQSSRWTGWQTSGLSDIFGNMMYGPGIWDRSEPLLAMEGGRGAATVAAYKRDPLKTGIISWNAHAYYTFHPTGPDRTAFDRTRDGMMTIFREPKSGLMWYPSELRTEPYLHVDDQWKEGLEELRVYSNAEEVELILNGAPFMKQGPSREERYEGLDHPPFVFRIKEFIPGTLVVNGLTGGQVIASQTIHTPGEPERIALAFDMEGRGFVADGSDIVVGHARVVDRNGTLCQDAEAVIRFTVDGPASVVGDGADIAANPTPARRGRAPVLLRASTTPGNVTITASAEGLQSATVTLATSPYDPSRNLAAAAPIHDFDSIRVDLGAADQLLQFDWVAWNGPDTGPSTTRLDFLRGVTASLRPASNGRLHWLGEMNVIGKYGFAYGEGAVTADPKGMVLEFADLPRGVYRLRTWHHAPRSNTDHMDPNQERLKDVNIYKLPHAVELSIEVSDAGRNASLTTPVTVGKEMQYNPVAVAVCLLESNGREPVRIQVRDPNAQKAVWLNAFELSQWDARLDPRPAVIEPR